MAAALASLFALSSFPAQAATPPPLCQGTAPFTTSCNVTYTIMYNHEEGNFSADTFAGLAGYTVDGPSGNVTMSCFATPGASTCSGGTGDWPFLKGETVRIKVSVKGAGGWSFAMSHPA
ncbi:MAG: hypothetical protein NVSMB57_08970 [Actinomycetota bacterium]